MEQQIIQPIEQITKKKSRWWIWFIVIIILIAIGIGIYFWLFAGGDGGGSLFGGGIPQPPALPD